MQLYILICKYLYWYVTENKYEFFCNVYQFKHRKKIKYFTDAFNSELTSGDKSAKSCKKLLLWLESLPATDQEFLSGLRVRTEILIRRLKQ